MDPWNCPEVARADPRADNNPTVTTSDSSAFSVFEDAFVPASIAPGAAGESSATPAHPNNLIEQRSPEVVEWGSNNNQSSSIGGRRRDYNVDAVVGLEKLPDSLDYLARLEARLRNLKNCSSTSSKNKGFGGASAAATNRKEAILSELLPPSADPTSRLTLHGIQTDEDIASEQEVPEPSGLVRHLVPAQPLTVGETVPLLGRDHLDINTRRGGEGEESEQNPVVSGDQKI